MGFVGAGGGLPWLGCGSVAGRWCDVGVVVGGCLGLVAALLLVLSVGVGLVGVVGCCWCCLLLLSLLVVGVVVVGVVVG